MDLSQLGISYSAIGPEIITALTGVLVMLVDAFSKTGARRANAIISMLGLLAALLVLVGLWSGIGVGLGGSYFAGMVIVDSLRVVFSVIVIIVAIIAVLLAGQFLGDEKLPAGEFFALLMFATCGMLMMVSAGDLVMVFLGLETTSIATYILAGYRRNDLRANESSLKYFLLGSFATAFLLYGMALTYGATGTTNIGGIRLAISSETIANPHLLLIGAAMMLVGFGFKIASAPFHSWAPDVYEGAPTLVTAFMATAPKAAVFAAFLRVFAVGLNAPGGGLGSEVYATWVSALAVIAAVTMTVGNVIALSQTNIKRMLAYSSIAHAGYALLGFVTADYAPLAFYMLVYAVMNLGAFAVIQVVARAGDLRTEISDFAGIGFEVPALSFPLAIFLLSLAGIPPTGGFIAKFYIFSWAWSETPELRWLVLIAIINSIISVYYYIYPIVVMFFRPLPQRFIRPHLGGGVVLALIITVVATLYLGLLPNRILSALTTRHPVKAVFSSSER